LPSRRPLCLQDLGAGLRPRIRDSIFGRSQIGPRFEASLRGHQRLPCIERGGGAGGHRLGSCAAASGETPPACHETMMREESNKKSKVRRLPLIFFVGFSRCHWSILVAYSTPSLNVPAGLLVQVPRQEVVQHQEQGAGFPRRLPRHPQPNPNPRCECRMFQFLRSEHHHQRPLLASGCFRLIPRPLLLVVWFSEVPLR
jgi:hypothetical protein